MRNLLALAPLGALALAVTVAHANTSAILPPAAPGGGGEVAAPPATPTSTQLSIGRARGGRVDRSRVELVESETGPRLRWTIAVSTRSTDRTEVLVPLEVSRDVSVQGFVLRIKGMRELQAVAATRSLARHAFDDVTKRPEEPEDPGLLSIVASDRRHDVLQLRVFPITRATPATIEIDLAIPGGNELVVTSEDRNLPIAIVDASAPTMSTHGASPRRWLVPAGDPDAPRPAPALTRARSLVALPWWIPERELEPPVIYSRHTQYIPDGNGNIMED